MNALELLESRRLLSAAVIDTVLQITGTPAADHVLITTKEAGKITVNFNGEIQDIETATLTGINVDLGGGADHFIVDESSGEITLPMTIAGGGGADFIIAGSGNDSISGGGGHDRIAGGLGDDTISGGGSRDLIDAGGGDDSVSGGTGDDAITTDSGNDVVSGGSGDDDISGGDGADTLSGGTDSDHLTGGDGTDDMIGGRGDDDLDGQAGADSLSGGGGADAFAKDSADDISDKTTGIDRTYTPFDINDLPPEYQEKFNTTFPNSAPLGVKINDDQTFEMIYRFNGDGLTYHAFFVFSGDNPFTHLDTVSLKSYQVAPDNLPPNTLAAFRQNYPDAVIKEVFVDHEGEMKFATIRIKIGDAESQWVHADWLDNT